MLDFPWACALAGVGLLQDGLYKDFPRHAHWTRGRWLCTGLVLRDCIDNEQVSPFGLHGPVPHEKHLIKLEPEKNSDKDIIKNVLKKMVDTRYKRVGVHIIIKQTYIVSFFFFFIFCFVLLDCIISTCTHLWLQSASPHPTWIHHYMYLFNCNKTFIYKDKQMYGLKYMKFP